MSLRIARVLLAAAARRWPGDLREELHQEWSAELHVLAEQRRHARMLRYAASLAVARPVRRADPVAAPLTGAARVARLVLVAPVLAVLLLIACLIAMNLVVGLIAPEDPLGIDPQLPVLTLFALCTAVLLARLGRKWTVAAAPVPLVLAVTVPGFAFGVMAQAVVGMEKVTQHAPSYAVFFLGLGAALIFVARLAAAGRRRAAWSVGILGATLAADVAVILTVLGDNAMAEESPHPLSAPVWLFTALTDSGFGLSPMQVFLIGDVVELDALLYLVLAALALGAVIAGSAARSTALDPAASPIAPAPSGGLSR
ncbi:hypothetical protein [Phytohabitans aurantiacus]|uniref:hypothetical protein n=1 Tax=Phytohabitans aurantiacus TaxID=3016789 RepID=UPI002492D088|nr:hypothetical protein [Phytohabitans aurantiacus]